MPTIEATGQKTAVQVGDVFVATFGYDETHRCFYEVVRVTKCKAEIAPICSGLVEANGPAGNKVVAMPGTRRTFDVLINVGVNDYTHTTKLCKVTTGYKGEVALVLEAGRYWAHPWYGEALYETDIMFGR